jgi:Zn-finger nucleic acid-binding protein
VNCQNCGAPLRLDPGQNVMVCDYCQSQCAPPVDEHGVQITGETGFACAVCAKGLATARIELREVLYCTGCLGIAVSMDNFVGLIDDLRDHRTRASLLLAPEPAIGSNGGLHCPQCQRAMDHHAYGASEVGEVMIDSCEACDQVWLDHGALRKLVLTVVPEPQTDEGDRDELARRLQQDPATAFRLLTELAKQLKTRPRH